LKEQSTQKYFLDAASIDAIIQTSMADGCTVVGPVVRDGAIVYDTVKTASDLPIGWRDEQKAKSYRLVRNDDKAMFAYAVGPHSWKRFLFPPTQRIFRSQRTGKKFEINTNGEQSTPHYVFLGVRPCEVAAMAIQDRVLSGGAYIDDRYKTLRERAFIIAVNCGHPAGMCFCASMGTGPEVKNGFDIALTEVLDEKAHFFAAEAGTVRGEQFLARIPHRPLENDEAEKARQVVAQSRKRIAKSFDPANIKEVLYENFEHPYWDEVAKRCISCANCTLVCPTCFCTTVEDVTDLTGDNAERWRRWDSCFTLDFSYIHGGTIRSSVRSRYRQWITHKLASWIDQFGTSGCVGCGRCITWCPVGIDITEEALTVRNQSSPQRKPQEQGVA